jgi:hypothetical protein
MTVADWTGFIGVSILLIAYFLNIENLLDKDLLIYPVLNFIGAGIACFASVQINYMPFILLEGCWTLVSAVEIFRYFRNKSE